MWKSRLGKKKTQLVRLQLEITKMDGVLRGLRDLKLGNSDAALTLMEQVLRKKMEANKLREELAPHMT